MMIVVMAVAGLLMVFGPLLLRWLVKISGEVEEEVKAESQSVPTPPEYIDPTRGG